MIDAYERTFTDEVWAGRHRTLWPLLDQNSPRNRHYKEKRMAPLRAKFDAEMDNLRRLVAKNDLRREKITGLKEDLFTGTSIQESRKSVENTEITIQQGHNIKLLTLVSIFFLPLTFVTSVFGMSSRCSHPPVRQSDIADIYRHADGSELQDFRHRYCRCMRALLRSDRLAEYHKRNAFLAREEPGSAL